MWAECLADVATLRERMAAVPVDDTAAWAQLAKETSGVFAAWSVQTEDQPGPLADASIALSRFSQVQANKVPVKRVPQPGMRQAAMLLMQATSSKSSAASQALLLHTMMQLLKAMHDHQVAARQHQAVGQVEAAVRGSLVRVGETLPPVPVAAGAERDAGRPAAADRFTAPGHAPIAGAVKPVVRPPLPDPGQSRGPRQGAPQNPGQGPGRRR